MAFDLPPSGYLGTSTRKNIEFRSAIDDQNAFIRQGIGGSFGPDLTIASGILTPTAHFHNIDTEGSASLDELTHIDPTNTMPEGVYVFFRLKSSSRKILIKPEQGGAGEIFLDTTDDLLISTRYGGILFMKYSTAWRMHGLVLPGGNLPHGYTTKVHIVGTTWTVPAGVQKALVTLIGGGGGGGGGSDGSSDGGAGASGTSTSISGSSNHSQSGGAGGSGGQKEGGGGGAGRSGLSGQAARGQNGVTSDGTNVAPGGNSAFSLLEDQQYSKGGKGGDGSGGGGGGGSGSPGDVLYRQVITTTPDELFTIVTGAGGSAGTHHGPSANAVDQSAVGGPGKCYIEW